jgi:filamentous hemagglutinin family protein
MQTLKEALALALCLNLVLSAPIAMAAPQDGRVVSGSAAVSRSGGDAAITQSSDRAVLNWKSFDIGKNESVLHTMPSPQSAALHRVVGGGGASQIEGLLKSNGNIYLVNPAGAVIHNGARIETGGFVASTRDIADENFMKGNMLFDRPGRPDAAIVNRGGITVRESGLAALVAPTVRNEGIIAAKLGKVALASGDAAWKLDMHGDDLIAFTVAEKDVNGLHAADGTPLGVTNTGTVKAEGGVVLLSASQLDDVVSSVVNSGTVSAASAEADGGRIIFRGEGAAVSVENSGTADASSAAGSGGSVRMTAGAGATSSGTVTAKGADKGGNVVVTGKEVTLENKARVDASGGNGGGTVLVGGNALGKGPEKNAVNTRVEAGAIIAADAVNSGDGGQVVIWSDGTTNFDGTISAKGGANGGDGGQVETSGHTLKIGDAARVNTSAPKGSFGEWLLDPVDFVIGFHNGDMSAQTLSENLARSNVIISSSNGANGTNGDIFVNDDVRWESAATLSLRAVRNVNINANITATGNSAGLNIAPGDSFNLGIGAKVTLPGANPRLTIAGRQYTVINSTVALQNMNQNTVGNYALGSDIDASATVNWHNGTGFVPVGIGPQDPFHGIFDGLGHTISSLTIQPGPSTSYIGLFGDALGAVIRNVGLLNAWITGGQYVGGLVGFGASTINNCYVSGRIFGNFDHVGGLIGYASGCDISNSYSSGNVTGRFYVGGFVGTQYIGNISNSYSNCDVNGSVVGGFAGSVSGATVAGVHHAIIDNSYSTGKVTYTGHQDWSALFRSGGFVASGSETSTIISSSYWNKETSGQTRSAGGIGLTTAQMNTKASFNGWDFDNVWSIAEGQGYPKLKNINGNSAGSGSTGSTGVGGSNTGGNSNDTNKPEDKKNILDNMYDIGQGIYDAWNGFWSMLTTDYSIPDQSVDEKNGTENIVGKEKLKEQSVKFYTQDYNAGHFVNWTLSLDISKKKRKKLIQDVKNKIFEILKSNPAAEVLIEALKAVDTVNDYVGGIEQLISSFFVSKMKIEQDVAAKMINGKFNIYQFETFTVGAGDGQITYDVLVYPLGTKPETYNFAVVTTTTKEFTITAGFNVNLKIN